MNKQIIVINGVCESGKDTFVTFCQEHLGTNAVWNYSSVSKVKEIALQCGWDGIKTPEARKFLSDLKDLTEQFCDMSYQDMLRKIEIFNLDLDAKLLFLHVREPEQIKRLCDETGALSMIVKRGNHNPDVSNHADANVLNHKYDIEIKNDGNLADFKETARIWCETMGY